MYQDISRGSKLKQILLYLHIHTPKELKHHTLFDIGNIDSIIDNKKTREQMHYILTQKDKISKHICKKLNKNQLKINVSVSGTVLDFLKHSNPYNYLHLKKLLKHENTEILGETHHHSITSIYSEEEFLYQIKSQKKLCEEITGKTVKSFKNTDFVINQNIETQLEQLNYTHLLAEASHHNYQQISTNKTYYNKLTIAFKTKKISDFVNEKLYKKQNFKLQEIKERMDEGLNSICIETWPLALGAESTESLLTAIIETGYDTIKITDLQGEKSIKLIDQIDFIKHNNLQEESIKNLYNLEKRIKTKGTMQLMSLWREITCFTHIQHMNYGNELFSAYDKFINFNNVIKTIESQLDY